ncbi:hypothetical protein SporoS204_11505 [Sporosarcina ureae]|uniref:Uncharacterized protein n=1 Tax=Sporosarcina ureae TaxID=1571 RepID=A0ABM6JXK5_SPOUR|nr:hypothetical protein SporoS204_11505 [Sporosarcina ureae]
MSDGFDLSLKNKVVRMCLWIVVPAAIIAVLLILLTEVPSIVPTIIPTIAWISFLYGCIFINASRRKNNMLIK